MKSILRKEAALTSLPDGKGIVQHMVSLLIGGGDAPCGERIKQEYGRKSAMQIVDFLLLVYYI